MFFKLNSFRIFSLLLLSSIALFGPSLNNSFFIIDDYSNIFGNEHIINLNFSWFWLNSKSPIISNFWQSITLLFGIDNIIAFRLISIFLHALNAYLVFFITHKIINHWYDEKNKQLDSSAILAAFFFLIFPVQVESVAWISSQRNLVSTFFALSSTLLYFSYRKQQQGIQKKNPFVNIFFVAILWIIGCLAKIDIVLLPVFFILIDFFIFKEKSLDIVAKKTLFWIFMIIFAIWYSADEVRQTATPSMLFSKIIVMAECIHTSLIKIFIPYPLFFSSGQTISKTISDLWSNDAFLIKLISFYLVVIVFIAILLYKKQIFFKNCLFLFLSFLVLLLPTSGIYFFNFQFNYAITADRYLYLSMLPISIFFGLIIYRLTIKFNFKKYTIIKLAIIYLTLLSCLTFQQSLKWKSSEIILNESWEKSPENYALALVTANAYNIIRDYARAEKITKAAVSLKDLPLEAWSLLFEIYINTKNEEGTYLYYELTNDFSFANKHPELFIIMNKYLFSMQKYAELYKNLLALQIGKREHGPKPFFAGIDEQIKDIFVAKKTSITYACFLLLDFSIIDKSIRHSDDIINLCNTLDNKMDEQLKHHRKTLSESIKYFEKILE